MVYELSYNSVNYRQLTAIQTILIYKYEDIFCPVEGQLIFLPPLTMEKASFAFFFLSFVFLGPLPRHMEVPSLGV